MTTGNRFITGDRSVRRWLIAYWAATFVALVILALMAVDIARADGTADTQAKRLDNAQQVTDTLPPPPKPSTRQLVNSLPYQHYNDVPAMTAYRLVAAERGWTSARIEAWAPFVRDVMLGESAFCWNRRRGDIVRPYSIGCVITRQGTHDDVGFGQATHVLYGPNGPLCLDHGYCGMSSILASPYDSMKASIVLLVEDQGSAPWCYSSAARSYHDCWKAPDR